MLCPNCESKNTKVVNSRSIEENVFRKRICNDCGYVFHTEEIEINDEEIVKSYYSAIKREQRKRMKS